MRGTLLMTRPLSQRAIASSAKLVQLTGCSATIVITRRMCGEVGSIKPQKYCSSVFSYSIKIRTKQTSTLPHLNLPEKYPGQLTKLQGDVEHER